MFAAPTLEQCASIVTPILNMVLRQAPEDLRPNTHQISRGLRSPRGRHEYLFHNPAWGEKDATSLLKLRGCDVEEGNRLRGGGLDFCYLDEVREVRNLSYLYAEVLAPQFVRRTAPALAMGTTPPHSMDHEFIKTFIPRGKEAGTYMEFPASRNKDWTDEDERVVLDEMGGKETIAWKREIECELISDPTHLITPEFQEKKDRILVEHWNRPDHFVPYYVVDGAYKRDKLAMIWGYVDWQGGVLVIEDSFAAREKTTRQIAAIMRQKEYELRYDRQTHKIRRRADMTEQQIGDLVRDYKLSIVPVQKFDADHAVIRFRSALESCKVRIIAKDGKNAALIHQLEHGVYNKRHTDYERSEEMGHWDLGKAAVYLFRCVNFRENPGVKDMTHDEATQWKSVRPRENESQRVANWRNALTAS